MTDRADRDGLQSNIRYSLRFRIFVSFGIAGLLMGLTYGGILYGYLHRMEDRVVENVLRLESEAYLARLSEDPTVAPPQQHLLHGFVVDRGAAAPFADWPAAFQRWAEMREPGLYEFQQDYHLLVVPIDRQTVLFMFHNDRGVEPLENSALVNVLLYALVMVTALTLWFGFLIARRLIAPLTQLAEQVAHAEPDTLPLNIAGRYYPDEVGDLARALEQSMTRIHQFIAREQRFTRDAGHELRTPVTVVRGAAELMQKQIAADQSPAAPLRRIQRAVRDMENIIETFLFLGREGSQAQPKGEAQIDVVVENLVADNRYLIEEKPVSTRIEIVDRFRVAAPEVVVAIAVGNILRNAYQYTDEGEVVVRVAAGRVVVRDSGVGISRHQLTLIKERHVRGDLGDGFGLGLSIVHDFCSRHGWHFDISAAPDRGTEVTLAFSPPVACDDPV